MKKIMAGVVAAGVALGLTASDGPYEVVWLPKED